MATQHVNDDFTESEERPESLWQRALVMIGFMIAFGMGQTIVHLLAILQFFTLVFSKRPSGALAAFGGSLAVWMQEVAAYQCMASDDKPFPWQPWPDAPVFGIGESDIT